MANTERIRQALVVAETNLKLAKQLLNDVEGGRFDQAPKKKVLPGTIGTYDGENLVTESGEKYPVPANYASKSMLVVGDTLKLVEENGSKRFKQIEHVKRLKTEGVLTKKEGKFHIVAVEGSYRVLPAAVDHFGGKLDDKLNIWIPANNQTAHWAAIESMVGGDKPLEVKTEAKTKSSEIKEQKIEIVKPEVKPVKPVSQVTNQKQKAMPSKIKPPKVEESEKPEIKKPVSKPTPKVEEEVKVDTGDEELA